ncbi:ATP-binding protein [Hymenobacter sp. NBH84]|uniref:AAA family ATPase n=1 Tax=Hymenobacter sp. NBH84 TaxID=2596915 RepID=UPI0016241512|nr:ATP-binding protein [Hymenobacter sp. NBH84]QNE40596.1 ATP-binding protein [Hymenobacter sp. NBH84]
MLRVSLTGPESTGKSTLSRLLAAHYGTAHAPEYARAYLDQRGPAYTLPDLEAIARGQLAAEAQATAEAAAAGKPVVFFDTDLLVIKIWAEHAFGQCPTWITDHLHQHPHDLTLLLDVDLPWEPDPLREHPDPAQRQYFYEWYRRELQGIPSQFVEVGGPPTERLARAVAAVDALLRNS